MTPSPSMRLSSTDHHPRLNPDFDRLARRIISPLTGLSRTLGFMMRGRDEPRIIVSGAQLTGVEHLLGRKSGLTYHIGGCGIYTEEALIRSVGETVERYAQVVRPLTADYESVFETQASMTEAGRSALVGPFARPFRDEQYAQDTFAYSPLESDSPITWPPTRSLITGETRWAPAQLLYIGYQLRKREGEPWLNSAVTTGSAAHTSPELAVRSALYELIHGDAAMGHWYTDRIAPQVRFGRRTTALKALLDRHLAGSQVTPTFHYLELPGFNVHVTACVMRGRPGSGRGTTSGSASPQVSKTPSTRRFSSQQRESSCRKCCGYLPSLSTVPWARAPLTRRRCSTSTPMSPTTRDQTAPRSSIESSPKTSLSTPAICLLMEHRTCALRSTRSSPATSALAQSLCSPTARRQKRAGSASTYPGSGHQTR